MKILIIGAGYIGQRCAKEWPDAILSDKIIRTPEDVLELLDLYNPDAVLNAAGIVGRPNVDWCETNQAETVWGNSVLPLIIAKACAERGVYLLHIGTGCIYYGYKDDPKGWNESDETTPLAVYTKAKYAADIALSALPNVGVGRIRMPIDYIPYRGNFIDKLVSFKQIISVENSVTVIEDMVWAFYKMIEKRAEGIYHVVNPGSLTHREIMILYKAFVNPDHKNEWIKESDLLKLGLTKKQRSNNILNTEKLASIGVNMRHIHDAIIDTMKKYAEYKKFGK
ncbi:MAG: sugar nucleotide-binding protein [bacterium]